MPYEPDLEQPKLFADINVEVGVSRKTVSRLTDIQEMTLARAFSGERNLSWPEFKVVRELLDDLIEIKHRFQGAPLDWSDVPAIRKLLNDLHEERKTPPSPLTPEESTLLSKFASNVPIEEIAIEMRTDRADVLEKIEGLLARATRLAEATRLQK